MKASIIIRTKNEEQWVGQVLDQVFLQEIEGDFEVIVVDSDSTDNTLQIVSQYDCRLITIPAEEFTWGYALNVGARNASGNYLVNLSAHAAPCNDQWLSELLKPFSLSNKIAGVYGAQLPRRGVDPFEEVELAMWFPQRELSESEISFTNSNSAIRRDIWKQYPFDEKLDISEDVAWANTVKKNGYHITYVPTGKVYHSHPAQLTTIYRRWYWRGFTTNLVSSSTPKRVNILPLRFFLSIIYWGLLDVKHFVASGYFLCLTRIPIYESVRQYARWKGMSDFEQFKSRGQLIGELEEFNYWADMHIPDLFRYFEKWLTC